jgi:CHAD domain-containing protein
MQTGTLGAGSVTKLLERLAYQVNHTLHTPAADSVHDLRIAIRRFSQWLVLAKPAYPAKDVKKIRRRLKELMELTNAPRDCDVALKLLAKSELTSAAALEQPIRDRRKEELRKLTPALRRWAARKTSSKWRAALTPGGATNADRLPQLFKRVLKHGARAQSGQELHKLRIEGKKLRYSLELLRPEEVQHVTELQSLLGRVNDCRAVRRLVAGLGSDPEVERWLKKRQKKLTREFQSAWPALEQSLRASLDHLRQPARKPMTKAAGQSSPASARRAG